MEEIVISTSGSEASSEAPTFEASEIISEVGVLPTETITYYENSLSLELAQTSLLIVIFITLLFSGIYKIGR